MPLSLDTSKRWSRELHLSNDSLKEFCVDAQIQICPAWESHMQWRLFYVPPEDDNALRQRVVRAYVAFQEGLKKMSAIRCVFKTFEFYVIEGLHQWIYRLTKDEEQNVLLFDSGPFRIRC
jgi:hypothetical protein